MTVARMCLECEAELPADAPENLCPKCLMQGALRNSSTPGGSRGIVPTATFHIPFEAPQVETLLGRFPQLEILEVLGQGGMGAVYKARQTKLDRLVALKIMSPDSSREPAFAERFAREARALAKLNHPNIVAVHDFGEADGLFYFVMEYVDGLNLRQLLQAGRVEPAEALRIIPQICDALQYAHEEGVIHRDIKPENILLDKKGRVKIADFGLAKLLGPALVPFTLTGSRQVMGTPHYMAPEQMEKPLTVDHRADIYSLGVVFYEMLTGELPLGRFAMPSKKAAVDGRLDEVVLKALDKEPEQRYQCVSDIKVDVEAITGRQSPDSPAANFPRAPIRKPDRQIGMEVAGPAVGIMFTGVLALLAGMAIGPVLTYEWFQHFRPNDWWWVLLAAWAIFALLGVAGFLAIGSVTMLRLSSYRLATAASIWAMLPWAYAYLITLPFAHHYISQSSVQIAVVACTVVWLLGLVMGRWALGVLKRPEVRQAFISVDPDDRPASFGYSAVRSIRLPAVGLISVGVLALLVGHMFFFLSAHDTVSRSVSTWWLLGPISGSFALLAATGFLIVGGYQMMKLRRYGLTMAAAVWAMLPWPWAFFVPLPIIAQHVYVDENIVMPAVLATSVVWLLSVFVGSMAVRVLKRVEVRTAFTAGLPNDRAGSVGPPPAGSPAGELVNRAATNINSLSVKVSGHHGLVRCEADALILEYFGGIFHSRVIERTIPFSELGSITLKQGWYRLRLILLASRLTALRGIPGSHEGEIRLDIRQRDRQAAQQFVADVRRRLADPSRRTPLPTAALAVSEPAALAAVQTSPVLGRMASLMRSVRSLVFNSSLKDSQQHK